jgi:hypothetical protein
VHTLKVAGHLSIGSARKRSDSRIFAIVVTKLSFASREGREMTISAEDLAKMANAALRGLSFEFTGMPNEKEYTDAFLKLQEEYENAPEGSMAYIPFDWPEVGAYDSIIEATERAYGKPLTLDEINAKKAAENQKSE